MTSVRRLMLRVTRLRLWLDRSSKVVGVTGRVADVFGLSALVHVLDFVLLALVAALILLDALLRLLARLTRAVRVHLLPRLVDLLESLNKVFFLLLVSFFHRLPNDICKSEYIAFLELTFS